MRGVFGVVLGAGVLGLVAWMVASTVAEAVPGWRWVDPEARLGSTGRRAVAAAVGFGMAGLSAAFAGWLMWAALLAALAGGGAAAWLAGRLGPTARDV